MTQLFDLCLIKGAKGQRRRILGAGVRPYSRLRGLVAQRDERTGTALDAACISTC